MGRRCKPFTLFFSTFTQWIDMYEMNCCEKKKFFLEKCPLRDSFMCIDLFFFLIMPFSCGEEVLGGMS